MKTYIVHYSKNTKRKKDFGLSEKWVTDWDREDLFVRWLKWYTQCPLSPNQLSCSLKHIWCLRDMIESGHQEAIVLEDDVVFETDWLKKFESVTKPKNILFLKLGSIFADIPYDNKIHHIGNPGGTEALWITNEFARITLNNLNFNQSVDIFYGALLYNINHPLLCIPVCSQTSVHTQNTSIGENKSEINWLEYIKNFNKFKRYSFENLWSEFHDFQKKKIEWENKFNNRFNCSIELNDYNFLNIV